MFCLFVNNRASSVGALVRCDGLHISLAVHRRYNGIGWMDHLPVKDVYSKALGMMRQIFEGGSRIHSTSPQMNKGQFNALIGSNRPNEAPRASLLYSC
jgi:hypothetical protein